MMFEICNFIDHSACTWFKICKKELKTDKRFNLWNLEEAGWPSDSNEKKIKLTQIKMTNQQIILNRIVIYRKVKYEFLSVLR